MEQRGNELENGNMEQVVRERWRMRMEGGQVMEDRGQSDEGC